MKINLSLLSILVVITLHVSAENQIETSLSSEMLKNSMFPDDVIISKLETALQSMDSRVQKAAIRELGMYVYHLHKSGVNTEVNLNTKRPIFKSRRSRDSLISYFNTEHARNGYDLSKQVELDMRPKIQQALLELRDEHEPGRQNEQLDVESLSERVQSSLSPWVSVPMTLATLWPNDLEVLEFLWQFEKNDIRAPLKTSIFWRV